MTPDLFEILPNLGHAGPDPPPIRLELGLARSPGADSTTQPLQVRPGAGQPREKIIELRQLHLKFPLAALGPLGENIQDEASPVHDPLAQQLLQIPLLRSGELFIQDDQVNPGTALLNLQRFPLPDEIPWVKPIPLLQDGIGDARPGGPSELFQFGQGILGLPMSLRVPADAHEDGHLGVMTNQRVMGDG